MFIILRLRISATKPIEINTFLNQIKNVFNKCGRCVIAISEGIQDKNKKIPYDIFNISSNKPEKLKKYVKFIQENIKRKINIKYVKRQLGDIKKTHGDFFNVMGFPLFPFLVFLKKYKYPKI